MDYDGESLLKVDGKKHKAFSNVYLVSMLLAGTTMALAGCVDEGSEASEENYWQNIRAYGEFSKSAGEKWNETIKVAGEGNYVKAIELATELEKLDEEAIEHAQSAVDVANTPDEKKWAECLIEAKEYSLLYDQKLIESIQYKKEGNDKQAIESIKIANNFSSEFLKQVELCTELKPLNNMGGIYDF